MCHSQKMFNQKTINSDAKATTSPVKEDRVKTVVSHRQAKAPDKNESGLIQKFFFLFLNYNICYDPSLKPSWQDIL